MPAPPNNLFSGRRCAPPLNRGVMRTQRGTVTDPAHHKQLRQFWYPASQGYGIGVTAPNETEALALAEVAAARYLLAGRV